MSYLDHCMAALVYRGRNRLKRAWLMARGSYAYTRSWDFGRWYAFKGAVALGWEYLWRPE